MSWLIGIYLVGALIWPFAWLIHDENQGIRNGTLAGDEFTPVAIAGTVVWPLFVACWLWGLVRRDV